MKTLTTLRRRVARAWHTLRHEGFVRLGPVYVTTWRRHVDSVAGGFELGREYERGQYCKEP